MNYSAINRDIQIPKSIIDFLKTQINSFMTLLSVFKDFVGMQ